MNPARRTVYLQKKTPGRYVFDRLDYADITVGGHYHAGEDIPAGVREVHEELGLHVDYADLHPLGIRQTAITLAPEYLEREFQHWHLLPFDADLEDIPFADAEVAGLVELTLDDAIRLADAETTTTPARYATRTDGGLRYSDGHLSRHELIPNYLSLDQLYLRLFTAADRFCSGQRRHLFW
ncbi:NUDIX domain-containing protein [Saccharomonospora iraqiensis]|uniref:NUDIX domain-containing protein n=1 Tax=Saccharomonospora iraqiensis TaxID=52698 RepID=UPI001F2DAA95|nr:NUDIX domain-containing protein [Saccharomonospora iraqiensis]